MFFLLFLFLFLLFSPTRPEPDNLHLKLIRPPQDPTLSRLDRIRGLVQSDQLRLRRLRTISSAGSPPPSPPPAAAFEMPVRSGAYTGTGQYFVRVRVGTPAQGFLLVADTGSDLTWVKCGYGSDPEEEDAERIFRADLSRTFRPISCSSDACRTDLPFSLTTCPTPETPCNYDYGYLDGSSAQGFYAKDSVTIALSNGAQTKRKLKGLLIGCTSNSSGASFDSSDGVLGLGHSNISFASRAIAQFGGRFSYCLVDHLSPKTASSYLTFGTNPAFKSKSESESVQETGLLIDPKLDPYYGAAVTGVSVDGEDLTINASVWRVEEGGGVIIDSGSSLTTLAEPAYRAVVAALSRRLEGVPRVKEDPFEYCYNWSTSVERNITLPGLAVHFAGGARLEPPAKSYLIDVAAGVKCLGFTSAPWPGVSTIGNIMQQEHLWEFDIKNRRLRFQTSTCTV